MNNGAALDVSFYSSKDCENLEERKFVDNDANLNMRPRNWSEKKKFQ